MLLKACLLSNIIFNCSPSLGILDNWLPIIYNLRQQLNESKFIFYIPSVTTMEQIDLNSNLIKISDEIFDLIVFKSHATILMSAKSFKEAKVLNNNSKIKSLLFLKKVFKKLKFDSFLIVTNSILKNISYLRFKSNIYSFEKVSNNNVVLFDLHELNKSYNQDFFRHFKTNPKFSILHGINVRGLQHEKIEISPVKVQNCIAYIWSEYEREFYKTRYFLQDENIKNYGIPRHDINWIKFLIKKEEHYESDFDEYIFIISRPIGPTVPKERKIEYIKDIQKISSKFNLPLVIKMHPRENDKELYENILGKENYSKKWIFSIAHPFILGKNCKFAICFFSGVPLDMLMLKVPTIERLTLKSLKKYEFSTLVKNDIVMSEFRFLDLVLSAENYSELEEKVGLIINDKEKVINKLIENYKLVFNYTDNINEKISNEIIEVLHKGEV